LVADLLAGRYDTEMLYLGAIDALDCPPLKRGPLPPQLRAWRDNGWDLHLAPDDGSWPACPTPWAPPAPPGALPGTPAPWWPHAPRLALPGVLAPPTPVQPGTGPLRAEQPRSRLTPEERRERERKRKRKRRAAETPEQREARLQYNRRYNMARKCAADPPPVDHSPALDLRHLQRAEPGGVTPD
jgi:hypothetical protein